MTSYPDTYGGTLHGVAMNAIHAVRLGPILLPVRDWLDQPYRKPKKLPPTTRSPNITLGWFNHVLFDPGGSMTESQMSDLGDAIRVIFGLSEYEPDAAGADYPDGATWLLNRLSGTQFDESALDALSTADRTHILGQLTAVQATRPPIALSDRRTIAWINGYLFADANTGWENNLEYIGNVIQNAIDPGIVVSATSMSGMSSNSNT